VSNAEKFQKKFLMSKQHYAPDSYRNTEHNITRCTSHNVVLQYHDWYKTQHLINWLILTKTIAKTRSV